MLLAAAPAETAYEAFAPFYDCFISGSDYEAWTDNVEPVVAAHAPGRRLLDAACGTGKSFLPFLRRGYEVTACDISAEMVARARAKAPDADVFVADVRELQPVGSFDLVTCLDDSLNYLTGDGDLGAALASLGANLAPDGVLVFDLNTLATYRTTFARDMALEGPDVFLVWRGGCDGSEEPGCVAELVVEAFRAGPSGLYERVTTRHTQRHHPRPGVERALAGAGLAAVGVFGLLADGSLDVLADEHVHHKLVYLAQRVAKGGDSQ